MRGYGKYRYWNEQFLKKFQKPVYRSFIALYSEMPAYAVKISRLCRKGLIYRCRFYFYYHSLSDFILCFRDELAGNFNSLFEDLCMNDYSISTNVYKAMVYLEYFREIFDISFSRQNLMPYRILAETARPLIFKEWGVNLENELSPSFRLRQSSQLSRTSRIKQARRLLKRFQSSPPPQPSYSTLSSKTRDPQVLAELEYHALAFDVAEIFFRWATKGSRIKTPDVSAQITSLIAYHKREYERKKRGA